MMTTNKKTILALLGAALLTVAVTSCSADDAESGNSNSTQIPITLSYSVSGGVQMRSTTDTHITTQGSNQVFTAGQKIDLFIDEALTSGTTATYQGEVRYLKSTSPDGEGAVGKGNFKTYSDAARSSEVTLYWPASGNGLYFYAYYPAGAMGADAITHATTSTRTFTVDADQGTASASKDFDLMFGVPDGRPIGTAASNAVPRPTDNQRAAAAVNLNFSHCLSKVVVTIKGDGHGIAEDGTDANDNTKNQLTGALVTLGDNDICLQASVEPNSGVATAKADGTKGTVTLKSNEAGNTSLTNYCILPPGQTLTGKKINIKLTDSGVKSFTIPQYSGSDVVLQPGMEYDYTVTVGLYEVSVTATVKAWTPLVGDDSATLKY